MLHRNKGQDRSNHRVPLVHGLPLVCIQSINLSRDNLCNLEQFNTGTLEVGFPKKQSLMTAYTMMLKEKYCDALGVLAEEYPSYYQFRYFYRKTRNLQNFYISRDGLKNYQRNNRPLTGEGVQATPYIPQP